MLRVMFVSGQHKPSPRRITVQYDTDSIVLPHGFRPLTGALWLVSLSTTPPVCVLGAGRLLKCSPGSECANQSVRYSTHTSALG